MLKLLLRLEVAAPAAQVNATKHNFAISRGNQRIGLLDHAVDLHRSALATNAGDDAERTTVVASILNLEIRPGFFRDAIASKNRSSDQLSVSKNVAYKSERRHREGHGFQRDKILRLAALSVMVTWLSLNFRRELLSCSDFAYAMLMRISHHPGHARKRGNFLRGPLGITARHHDLCHGVFAMDTANRGASVLIGGGGDGAGIQDDHVGFLGRLSLREALCRKLTFQGGPIRLGGAAAKTLYKKSGHERYYNGTSKAAPVQQLTTNGVAACILS